MTTMLKCDRCGNAQPSAGSTGWVDVTSHGHLSWQRQFGHLCAACWQVTSSYGKATPEAIGDDS